MKVGIVGAGIGGVTAALALLRAGFEVDVYEQAGEVSEVGAGINISPNASRVLHGLGLDDALAAMGVRPVAFHQRRWEDGRTLVRTPFGDSLVEAFGFPHYQTHRADLLAALLGRLPSERLHVGHRFTGLFDAGDRVEASFEGRNSAHVDILIGADGIHSAVRETLYGRLEPRFTGCVAYRGLIPAERLHALDLDVTSEIWMGPGQHFVRYFVQDRRLVNFVAIVEQDTWTAESWTDRGEVADAIAAFEGWHPQVRSILEAVDETFVWALFDRQPLDRWSHGRVTLLGDACHPMLPFMAQGAAQAIEDAASLAACLVREPEPAAALRLYESIRLPRASRIQALSAQNKTRFHLPDGSEQEARDAEMARGTTDWSASAVAWIFGHDAGVVD